MHHSPLTDSRHLHLTMGSGVAWLDLERDGWPDLCLAQGAAWDPDQLSSRPALPEQSRSMDRLYRNLRGQFQDVTIPSGLINAQYSMGLAAGDMDNDGFCDLLVTCFGTNRLFHNCGDGTFEDVSAVLGIQPFRFCASGTWTSINGDEYPDLYVTNYLKVDPQNYAVCTQTWRGQSVAIPCPPRRYEWPPDTILIGNGDGTFQDVSETFISPAPVPSAGLGVVTADLNGDSLPDLYVANDTTANFLLIQQPSGCLQDTAVIAGAAYNRLGEGEAGMGVAAGDVDGDGRLDLFVGNYYGESNTLYRNEGQGLFLDVTAEFGLAAASRTRLAFGTLLTDFNNDGWLDIFVANGHLSDRLGELGMPIPFRQKCLMHVNDRGRRFVDHSLKAGEWFDREIVGRGCAAADFDRDGRSDLVVQSLNDPVSLLRNSTENAQNFVAIDLVAVSGCRDAAGAMVEVLLKDRTLLRHREGSTSYLSCGDGRILVGLGPAGTEPFSVRIRWPGGQSETWSGIHGGEHVVLIQGRAESGHPDSAGIR